MVPTLSPEGCGRYQTWPLLLGFWVGFGGFGVPFGVLVRWIAFSRIVGRIVVSPACCRPEPYIMIYPEAFAQAKAYGGHTPRTFPQELRSGDAPLGLSDDVSLSDGAPPAFNMAKTGWEGDASNAQSPARDKTVHEMCRPV